ncbi:putative ADG1-like protein [Trypanosoma cruzi]|uniref:ADG1, putative n=2 Tax=Trypanosoma cruzi TaxID=5693 RepID=Q4CSH0_TRYCC|nr:ADG1, putative [Trypanosoma cruzi]EAN83222.1 ADG1, putative [Trypanosoma cruzi]PWV02168.1 putative ADG1-like protein [Trypanosoma cruzi]RNC43045.1 ADG1 protein [Trypanosoma cruzi]|eukprot:XP_805073.1 ADG1 [Trypanosoma cruzi strain CL Brener]
MSAFSNSPVYKQILRPLRSNSMLGLCVMTGCMSVFVYWWYARSIRATLRQTQESCQITADNAFAQSRQLLKSLGDDWAQDMKSRDDSVRRLELQNVEQTRSIARLDAAMKMCIAPGPEISQ